MGGHSLHAWHHRTTPPPPCGPSRPEALARQQGTERSGSGRRGREASAPAASLGSARDSARSSGTGKGCDLPSTLPGRLIGMKEESEGQQAPTGWGSSAPRAGSPTLSLESPAPRSLHYSIPQAGPRPENSRLYTPMSSAIHPETGARGLGCRTMDSYHVMGAREGSAPHSPWPSHPGRRGPGLWAS